MIMMAQYKVGTRIIRPAATIFLLLHKWPLDSNIIIATHVHDGDDLHCTQVKFPHGFDCCLNILKSEETDISQEAKWFLSGL